MIWTCPKIWKKVFRVSNIYFWFFQRRLPEEKQQQIFKTPNWWATKDIKLPPFWVCNVLIHFSPCTPWSRHHQSSGWTNQACGCCWLHVWKSTKSQLFVVSIKCLCNRKRLGGWDKKDGNFCWYSVIFMLTSKNVLT